VGAEDGEKPYCYDPCPVGGTYGGFSPILRAALFLYRSRMVARPQALGSFRSDRAGAMADEELNAIVGCSDLHSMAMFQSPAYTTTTCSTYSIAIARAPFGHLNDFLRGSTYGQVIKSVKTDNVWLHRMVADQNARFQAATQAFNRVAAQSLANLKAEGEAREQRAKEFDANLAASTKASMAAAQSSQNARSQFAHQVVNFASDKADYINPATGQQLNIDYNTNHSWGSTDGTTTVLNNDTTYNPNGVVDPVGSSFVDLVPKQ
jgi:hypothetical protein